MINTVILILYAAREEGKLPLGMVDPKCWTSPGAAEFRVRGPTYLRVSHPATHPARKVVVWVVLPYLTLQD